MLWLCSGGVSHAQHKRAHYVKSSHVVCCVVLVSDHRDVWLAATKLSPNQIQATDKSTAKMFTGCVDDHGSCSTVVSRKTNGKGCEFVIAPDLVWMLPWHFSKLCTVTKDPRTWGLSKLERSFEDFSVVESSLLSNNKTSVLLFYLCLISTVLKLTRNSWPWAECKLLSMWWLPQLQITFNIRLSSFFGYLLVVTIMVLNKVTSCCKLK